jgi:hypothetical protein
VETKNNIPWEWVTEDHIKEFGYSGTLIRALRIKSNYTRETLASLLHKRMSFIKKIETTDKVTIAIAKSLQKIFYTYTDDWRVFRKRPKKF